MIQCSRDNIHHSIRNTCELKCINNHRCPMNLDNDVRKRFSRQLAQELVKSFIYIYIYINKQRDNGINSYMISTSFFFQQEICTTILNSEARHA